METIEQLKSENARLREALEWMVSFMPDPNLDKDSIQAAAVNQARIVLNSPDFKIYDVPTGYPYQEKYKRPSALSPLPEPEPFKAGQWYRDSHNYICRILEEFEPGKYRCEFISKLCEGMLPNTLSRKQLIKNKWTPIPAPEVSNG